MYTCSKQPFELGSLNWIYQRVSHSHLCDAHSTMDLLKPAVCQTSSLFVRY